MKPVITDFRRRSRHLATRLVAANLIVLFVPVLALITYRGVFLPQATTLTAESHLKDMTILLAQCGLPETLPAGFHYAWLPDTGAGVEDGGAGGLVKLAELRRAGALMTGLVLDLDADRGRRAAVARGREGWFLLSEPASRFEPALYPHVRRVAIVVQLTLLIAFILSLLLAWSIIKPMQHLERVARQVAEGRAPDPVPSGGQDEISEIAVGLGALLGRLHDQMKTLTTYAAESSHRLRTGLTAIRGAAEMLGDESLDPERRGRFLRNIAVEVGRMERSLKETLTMARLEAEAVRLERSDFDLAPRLRDVADALRTLAPGVAIETTGLDGACVVNGDPTRLEEAVAALLENAVKFAAPSGTVRFGLAAERDAVVVTVEDSGPGVAPDLGERVFDRFFTTGEPCPDGTPATGLGLSIARAIARLHEGEITLERSSLGGARFLMRIPHLAERLEAR